jgi:uncharacterized protein YceK
MRKIVLGVAVLILSGCSSVSTVTPIGDGKYMVGSTVHGGFTSWDEVKRMAVDKAASFCQGQSKELTGVQTQTEGARGWTPQEAEVTFSCK